MACHLLILYLHEVHYLREQKTGDGELCFPRDSSNQLREKTSQLSGLLSHGTAIIKDSTE